MHSKRGKRSAGLRTGTIGNDLRIVGESFCKDIIDVLVKIAGFNEEQINTVLHERAPHYERPRGDWNREIATITMGSAHLVISAFGPLAFPINRTRSLLLLRIWSTSQQI